MKVIAQSASAYLVYINPSKIKTEQQKTLVVDGLTEIFELDREKVLKKAERNTSGYEKIIGQINQTQKDALSKYMVNEKLKYLKKD